MNGLLSRIFSLERYTTPAERERGRVLYAITAFAMLFSTLFAPVAAYLLKWPLFTINGSPATGMVFWMAVGLVGGTFSLWVTRRNWRWAAVVPITLYFLLNPLQQWPLGMDQGAPFVFLVLMGGALHGLYGALAMMFVSVGSFLLYMVTVPSVFPDLPLLGVDTLGKQGFNLLIALAFVYVFLRFARAREKEGELASAQQRFQLAEITTRITGRLNRASLGELQSGAVNLIRDSYPDMYHVQIFLLDEGRSTARLTASTGEVGQLLLARAHALAVGSQSVIGQVSATARPVVARAGDKSSVHRRNELLPETAAEAAFPLRVSDQVIGVLDLQSRDADAFSAEEMPIFQSLADSIAIVIDNVRLTEETQVRLAENERLLSESQTAMREVEMLNQQLTNRGWQDFISGRSETAFSYSAGERVTQGAEWTPTLAEALEFDRVVQAQDAGSAIVTVPLHVRGQVIGAMEFELEGGQPPAGALALLQQVSERLGISLDSLRSFDQARELAAQQERVSDISARYQQVSTVDDLLRITLDELSDTLGAERGAIRLGAAPAANGHAVNGVLS